MPDPKLAPSGTWPDLPLEDWRETKETLHRYTQILGKIRLALHPPINHWWHVTLYVTTSGLTTGVIPDGDRTFALDLDLTAHRLRLTTSDGRGGSEPLPGHSVASFYQAVRGLLEETGIAVEIRAVPYDLVDAVPFTDDRTHAAYDTGAVERFFQVLSRIDTSLWAFRGRFRGKVSPVHFFWHSFDLAVTRFSGRSAPVVEGMGAVSREAYSHEVISAGFWPGDDMVPEPAFYAYAYPEPPGLSEEPLRPAAASWRRLDGGGHQAFLPYRWLREAPDPRRALDEFLQSTYEACAHRAGWDRAALERA
jgi:hypothetical protein